MSALSGSPVCPQCGAAASVSIGRCIHCGFLFTEATPPVSARVGVTRGRARPRIRPQKTGLLALTVLLGGLVVVAAISALAWTTMKRGAEERRAASSARPAESAPPAPAPTARTLEASVLIAQAKSRALAWHRDALLIEIDAAPVASDGTIASSGSVSFVFGKPAGASVGTGSVLQPAQFQVVFDGSGAQAGERAGARARAVAEPNCLVEDVVKVVASAAPSAGSVRLRYLMSEKLGRAVWRVYEATGNELLRTLDGVSCNILADK